MPIMPEDIATATFSRARQGYHPGEVEAFLNEVAADYGAALEKMVVASNEHPQVDVGQEVNTILNAARGSANAVLQRAEEEAESILKAATEKAQGMETQASQARVRTFEQATKEADRIREEAEQYSFELRNRTEHDARRLVEGAESRARQLFAYNQQLSQHLEEIERLVSELRTEIDMPQDAWPDKPVVQEQVLDGETGGSVPPARDNHDRERLLIAIDDNLDDNFETEGISKN
jgi:DivIVA domain-containing protein